MDLFDTLLKLIYQSGLVLPELSAFDVPFFFFFKLGMRLKNWKDGNGRSLDCGEEEDGSNDSLGPSCLLAKWAIACSSAIREEEAGSFRLKDTFDRTQRRPTSSLPSLAEAAAPVCSYFRCLLLCTFASTANTSPGCWPWPGTLFSQFTLLGKSDPPGQHAAGCWRLIVIFTAFVTLCCAWSCFLLQERLVCCDGEGRLASAPVHRLQGSAQEMVNDFLGQPTGEGGSLLICICIYIYIFKLTQRFLFEVGTLQTVFGCCPGFENQKGNQLLNKLITLYSDPNAL